MAKEATTTTTATATATTTTSSSPSSSSHVALRGLRLLRRPARLRAVLALPRHTHLSESCRWACERLGVEPALAASTDAAVALCTAADAEQVHLVVLDARNNRVVDAEAVAR